MAEEFKSFDADLEELASLMGGDPAKTKMGLQYEAGWDRESELSDYQILLYALRMHRGRYPQWKMMLGEVIDPSELPIEREVEKGEISLKPTVVTDFHKEFVTEAWLAEVEEYISQHHATFGLGGSGLLIPSFNEDCYMGPQSIVKYRFNVTVILRRPNSPLKWQVAFLIEYRPDKCNFRLLWFSLSFDWRLELLKKRFHEEGFVQESVFENTLKQANMASRVRRLFGLASPVRYLQKQGHLTNEQLKAFLQAHCGVTFIEEEEIRGAESLWREGGSKTYRSVKVQRNNIQFVVMENALTVEEFNYAQAGSGGALPAFTSEGLVTKRLAELGVQP